jgi:hypothetical protein
MIHKEKETQYVDIIKDIICNKCGNSCKATDCNNFVYASLNVHWGYGSVEHDGEVHEAHLCEKCWENIVATFKFSDLVATEQY